MEVMALTGDTIMVVEDDDATRAFLADNLQADSYEVVTATNARQALNLLEVKDCDLILLDVMLPDASGFELCRRLREADGLAQRIDPQLPVIMLTGRASETDRVRGFARGADDYVVNPTAYLFSAC
jgi:DNA-binding response OmpR family regulator